MFGLCGPMQGMRHSYHDGGPIANGMKTGCKIALSHYLPVSYAASLCHYVIMLWLDPEAPITFVYMWQGNFVHRRCIRCRQI